MVKAELAVAKEFMGVGLGSLVAAEWFQTDDMLNTTFQLSLLVSYI